MQELEILDKFKKKGFNQLSTDDLAAIQQSTTWAKNFKQATNEDWAVYSEKAGDKLTHSDFNIKKGNTSRNSYSVMFNSILRGDAGKLLEFLRVADLAACRKALDNNSKSALHVAAREGQLEIVKILLEKGWEVDCKDKYNTTPLHQAANLNHFETVSFLFESGSDPTAKDSLGRNALMYAVCGPGVESTNLLVKIKDLIYTKDFNGKSPLHYAVYNPHGKQSEIFHVLVKFGADVNAQDESGKTPLHHACESGKVKAIRWLIKHGANSYCKDNNFNTPHDLSANNNIKKLLSLCNISDKAESVQKSYSEAKFSNTLQMNKPLVDPKPVYKENLLNFLSQVQEAGIINKQHIKKPQLYTGNWMEGVLSPIGLFNELSYCTPSEAVLKVFNVLFPYSKPYPQHRETEIIMDQYFASPYTKTRTEIPIFIPDETEAKKISQELEIYKKNLSSLKESYESKEKYLSDAEKNLKQKDLEIEKLKTVLQEKQSNIEKISNDFLRNNESAEPEMVKDLKIQLVKAEKRVKELSNLNNRLQHDLDSRPQSQQITDLNEKISQIEADNRNLRFKAGQIFLKSIGKPEEPDKHPGQVFVQDLEILKRLDISLKAHPPGLAQRLNDADFDQDGKITKSEAGKVFSGLDLPPQDIISLLRIVGFRQGNAEIEIDFIENLLGNIEEKEKILHFKLFNGLLKKLNDNSLGVERAFAYLDVNNDGQVTFSEFSEGCEKLRIDLNREDRHALFSVLDSDHNGTINLHELKAKLSELKDNKPPIIPIKSPKIPTKSLKKLEIIEKGPKELEITKGKKVLSNRINGILIVDIIKARDLKFENSAIQCYIEGHNNKLKSKTLPGKDPEWRFKGKFKLEDGPRMFSNDLTVELVSDSKVQACVKILWNSALDYPNTWTCKEEYPLLDSINKTLGYLTVHLMWVPKESIRSDALGNLHLKIDSFVGFPSSLIEFAIENSSTSKPLKKSEEFILKNIQILGENPVPSLKCSLFKADDKSQIISKNLSIELALGSKTWTQSLKIPMNAGQELSISFKWEEFSSDLKAEIKAATKIQAMFKGYKARKQTIIPKSNKKVAMKIFRADKTLYLVGCFQKNLKTNIELHEVSDNRDLIDTLDKVTIENMNLVQILKNLQIIDEKIVVLNNKSEETAENLNDTEKIPDKKVARKVLRVNNELYVIGCFQKEAKIKLELHQVSDNRDFLEILDAKTVENTELLELINNLTVENEKILIKDSPGTHSPNKIALSPDSHQKPIARKVQKLNGRYFMISIYDLNDQLKIVGNLADHPTKSMFEVSSQILTAKQPPTNIFQKLSCTSDLEIILT